MTEFDAFKAADGGEPIDGIHTARLVDAALILRQDGQRKIKLTWQTTDFAYWWESWHQTEGKGKGFTKDILAGLNIALDVLGSWEELEDELENAKGRVYEVGVQHNGDWLNTSVEGPGNEQLDLPMQSPIAEPAGRIKDEDIPF